MPSNREGQRPLLSRNAHISKPISVFQPIADEISASLVFDPAQREPGERVAYIPKADLKKARSLLAQGGAKLSQTWVKIEDVTGSNVPLTGDPKNDERAIALAVKAYHTAMEATLLGGC